MSSAPRFATFTRIALCESPTTWLNSRAAASRCWRGAWRRFTPTRTLTPWWWPRRITGTRRPPSSPVRRARMSTSKSRSATTFGRGENLSRRCASTGASCRLARRIAVRRTPSRHGTTFSPENWATCAWSRCSTSRGAGHFTSGQAAVHRRGSRGKPGLARPSRDRITAVFSTLAGTIFGTIPAATWPMMASTSSTSR